MAAYYILILFTETDNYYCFKYSVQGKIINSDRFYIYHIGMFNPRILYRRHIMASEKIVVLTKENFDQEVLQSDKPVLVDFWAQWCGPCRAVSPIMDELAGDYDGKAKVAKLNVDEQREVAEKFRIMSIPTVMVFKDGQMVEKLIGARSKSEYAGLIDKHL